MLSVRDLVEIYIAVATDHNLPKGEYTIDMLSRVEPLVETTKNSADHISFTLLGYREGSNDIRVDWTDNDIERAIDHYVIKDAYAAACGKGIDIDELLEAMAADPDYDEQDLILFKVKHS